MENRVLILIAFGLGFLISLLVFLLISFLFLKKREKNREKEGKVLVSDLLLDFKNALDEYKKQNEINLAEVKCAIKPALDLTKILTTNQNLKGKFGENSLENIIKYVYPNENIDYIKQIELKNEDNNSIKPDYLIKLPNNNSILIDSKVNLENYIEYVENKGTATEKIKKQDFIRDIQTTIKNLANKKYETALNQNQPGFVLMYIPLETVVTLIYTDKDFLNIVKYASDKNIIIVGVSSVLTVLKLSKLLWARFLQDNNIKHIVDTAQNLYELIAIHSNNLYEMKSALENSLANFNKEYEKMINGSKLFKTIETLKQYGIEAPKKVTGKNKIEISINSDFLN